MTEPEQDVQQHGIRWIERWYGSDPMKGSAILTEIRSEIAVLGGDEETHKEVRKVVMAHNAALAAFAEREARLVQDMQAIMDYFETSDGNAPGHGHLVPGVWDKDAGNGPKGGLICHWCKQWNDMRATLAAIKESST